VAVMWSQLQTGATPPKPLILIGSGWESTFRLFFSEMQEYIAAKDREWLRFAPDVSAAVQLLQSMCPMD